MKKVLIVFGTRPEAIKLAPLIQEFKKYSQFEVKICVTAQHRELLDNVLSFFNIIPDYDLNLMKPNQNLYALTSDVITSLKPILEEFKPDYVFVHGDTTTSMSTSIASFYSGAKICHIEAGLRTYNKLSPFPEEINRQITSRISDYHFSPTLNSKNNLLLENINDQNIEVTGNTVIDALLDCVNKLNFYENNEIRFLKNLINESKKIILFTLHRRENQGKNFKEILEALIELSNDGSNVQIIYPIHLNPKIKDEIFNILGTNSSIHIINPLSYPAFVWLMNKSYIILTDSGGVQEEAPSLGKPVLVLRDTTERPEALEAGTIILVGANKHKILHECHNLLKNKDLYKKMSLKKNPYGDGNASNKILNFMLKLI
jgi:UDP-N-acetylglucosamine 2-epimerase (non-hydrolysing)